MFEKKVVQSISDIYKLNIETLTPFFLNEESIAAEKKSLGAEKVIKSIENHKTVSLSSFVAGFDIEGIGEVSIEKLVNAGFDSLEKILSMSVDEVASVYGFAQTMANTLIEGLKENCEELQTKEIQAAIDECASNGGGTVVIENGTYITGTIFMKSNV